MKTIYVDWYLICEIRGPIVLHRKIRNENELIELLDGENIESILNKMDLDINQFRLYSPYATYICNFGNIKKALVSTTSDNDNKFKETVLTLSCKTGHFRKTFNERFGVSNFPIKFKHNFITVSRRG